MIQSVVITNHAGESITLDMGNLEESGFLIQDIDGLNPCKATVNMTDMASTDGAVFNSARLSSRNIVFTLKLGKTPSIEANRLKTYKYFPIKKRIRVRIKTDSRECETYGYVEGNDIDIFSKAEGCIISVICPDPYFYSLLREVTIFSNEQAAFEFPFSNESLTTKLLTMSVLQSDTTKNIVYTGDASVGMVIYIHSLGSVSNLTIYDTTTRETFAIDSTKLLALTGSDIIEGDDIVISTIRGNKFVVLIRDGEEINILNCIGKDNSWFQLNNGDNVLAYSAESGIQNLQFRVENQILYEGV